jgi:flavin-binding protein dodecin
VGLRDHDAEFALLAARPASPGRAKVRGEPQPQEDHMAESVYRVTEVVGVSSDSWEQAAKSAVETVGQSVRDLRIAEVVRQDVTIEDGKVSGFRVRLGVSFKYEK